MDATQSEVASSSTLGDQLTTSENVKNLKRKVISVSKLMEVFKNKEIETAALKKQVEEAQKEIVELREKANDKTQLEQAQLETKRANAGQKAAEESLNRVTQRLRSVEALNTQLEAKTSGLDHVNNEVAELQKKLINMQKEHDQANRKRQEMSEMREKLMRAEADKANRLEWLAEQKKRWEIDEKLRQGKQQQELQDKVDELEHQLEDIGTERYLEMEMAKEELKSTEDKLRTAHQKLEENSLKLRSLNQTVLELRKENGTLERKLATFESERDTRDCDIISVEEFEEVIPSQDRVSTSKATCTDSSKATCTDSSKATCTDQRQMSTLEATRVDHDLPRNQLDRALGTIEDLMTQFSVLRMFSGSQDDKQRMVSLVEQVKTLTKEKQALQNELTRRLMEPPPTLHASLTMSLPSINPNTPATNASISAPILSDTIARTEPPNNVGRKRRVIESTPEITPEPAKEPEEALDYGLSIDNYATNTNANKRKRKSVVPTAPSSPLKPRKPRVSKKTTKRSSVDLSHIQIRNISINPIVPSISIPRHYFSSLMNSAIVDDSQPYTKLDAIAKVLPEKLGDLFDAVQAKTKEITDTVSDFRTEKDILQDDTETWTLEDFEPIVISNSLCTAEVYIVQLLCILQERFPEMDIISRFFVTMHDFILKNAWNDEQLYSISVLSRVVTGVCRSRGDIERPRILAFDILREISSPKASLVLCESIASIWPSVFITPRDVEPDDLQRPILKAFQAVLSTHQEAIKNVEIPFGYDTFIQKCEWPSLADAPFVDELVEEMMNVVRAPEFMDVCSKKHGYNFTLRKALELLIVHGFEWIEIYNQFIKPELFKMMIDGSLYAFALPLVAAITRETRYKPSGTSEPADDTSPIRELLEAILDSEATLSHQTQSALAILELSNGRKDQISMAKEWHNNLNESDRRKLPEVLHEIFQ
ncbi:hypothetical protein BGX21_000179 [Mortierella sp. AD011]|nr:hypothetical protein BGX21_000179 [Mortierella sp. AD011]